MLWASQVWHGIRIEHLERRKGGKPLSFATEIITEIKQFNFGRMASHPFIESNRRCIVFPSKMCFYLYKSFYILM